MAGSEAGPPRAPTGSASAILSTSLQISDHILHLIETCLLKPIFANICVYLGRTWGKGSEAGPPRAPTWSASGVLSTSLQISNHILHLMDTCLLKPIFANICMYLGRTSSRFMSTSDKAEFWPGEGSCTVSTLQIYNYIFSLKNLCQNQYLPHKRRITANKWVVPWLNWLP